MESQLPNPKFRGPYLVIDERKLGETEANGREFTDEEIRQCFQAVDIDKNMSISVSELKHVLTLIGEEVTDREVDDMLRLGDVDGSGAVSFDGFYRLFCHEGEQDNASKTSKASSAPKVTTSIDYSQMGLLQILAEFSKRAQVTSSFIRSVYKKLYALDSLNSGKVNYHDMCVSLEMPSDELTSRLFKLLDLEDIEMVYTRRLLICLLMHTNNSIKIIERIKISFSLARYRGTGDNGLTRRELGQLLEALFLPYPNESGLSVPGTSTMLPTRINNILQAVYSTKEIPETLGVSFDQFMELVYTRPDLVFPSSIVHEVSNTDK